MSAATTPSATSLPVSSSVSSIATPASAPIRFEPVSPSIARSRSVNHPTTRTGPTNTPTSSSGSTVVPPMQSPASSATKTFSTRPGPQVEQVEQVRGEQEERQIGDVVEPLLTATRRCVGRQGERPGRLDRPGREAPVEDRPRVTAPAPRGIGRGAAAERVVEQAQQRYPEDVDGPAPELRVEQVEVGAIVQHRERSERQQRAGDQHRAGRERHLAAAEVRPHEAVPAMSVARALRRRRPAPPRAPAPRASAGSAPGVDVGSIRSGNRLSAVSFTP